MNAPAKEYDGKNKYIRITDIDEETLTYKQNDIVSPNGKLEDKYLVKENDILWARTGASTGKAYLYDSNDGLMYYAGFLIRGNVKPSINSRFVFLQTQTLKYKKWVDIMSIRSGQPGINSQEYSSYKFLLPPLKIEQDKISSLFALLDNRIATQNRIIDKLQSLMKGLNNCLMDNSSWENVRVGDFMDFYSTNSLSWEQLDYKQGKIKNLHYGLIHSGLPTLIDCCLCTLPNIKDEFLLKQHTLCEDGDVAFADASEDTNEVGKAVEFYNCKEQSVVCGLHTIHGRDKANLTIVGFKGFAFNAKYFHDQLRRISQGSKIYSISTENVKSCYLRIPSKSVQRQVARLLSTFLQKINIAEQELKAYQEQKKYLLKAMFV